MQVVHTINKRLISLCNDKRINIFVAHWCKKRILLAKQFDMWDNVGYNKKGIYIAVGSRCVVLGSWCE